VIKEEYEVDWFFDISRKKFYKRIQLGKSAVQEAIFACKSRNKELK
jgi:hypothetical protein